MERLEIEFHDSRVQGLCWAGSDLTLLMKVYVHASSGRPGHDPGRGWYQAAQLQVAEARVVERHTGDELWIRDGSATIAGHAFANLLPLPCEAAGPVELAFSGAEGVLRIAGSGLRVVLTGEPGKVEQFGA